MPQKLKHTEKKVIYSDLARLDTIKDEDIDYSDIPDQSEKDWSNALWIHPPRKDPITMRLDRDIIVWFKQQVKGRGYQTAINNVLREYVRRKKSA